MRSFAILTSIEYVKHKAQSPIAIRHALCSPPPHYPLAAKWQSETKARRLRLSMAKHPWLDAIPFPWVHGCTGLQLPSCVSQNSQAPLALTTVRPHVAVFKRLWGYDRCPCKCYCGIVSRAKISDIGTPLSCCCYSTPDYAMWLTANTAIMKPWPDCLLFLTSL